MHVPSKSTDIRSYYDQWGAKEHDRLILTPRDRVSYEVHRRFLDKHISVGMKVLELGAGTGRFTAQMIEAGAKVLVTDISPVQLDLSRRMIASQGLDHGVEGYDLCDITDLSAYADGQFDAVVAYGGPLSYAFEHELEAMKGMLRVVRSGGPVVASVMSLPGTWSWYVENRPEYLAQASKEAVDELFRTGDMHHVPAASGHVCRMFRWAEIEKLVGKAGGRVLSGWASNFITTRSDPILQQLEQDPVQWASFLDREVALCAEPGSQNAGTHILFAASQGWTLTSVGRQA